MSTELIKEVAEREYEFGWVTDIESEGPAAGPRRGRGAQDLGDQRRAGVRAELAAEGLSPLADVGRAGVAQRRVPQDRLPGDPVLLGPEEGAEYQSMDEVDPKLLETYEKAGDPPRGAGGAAGVAVDAVFDSVSVKTTFREELAEHGIIFCSFSEAVKDHRS